eukprot:5456884-Pyramimonas_sp.AAC.1
MVGCCRCLPSCDWFLRWVYTASPRAIGSPHAYLNREVVRGSLAHVDPVLLGVGLHAGGGVDRVAEEAKARVHGAHHAAHHRARVEAHADVQIPARGKEAEPRC